MTIAAEKRARAVKRHIDAIFPESRGYNHAVYVEGYQIVVSTVRDESYVWMYIGDKRSTADIVKSACDMIHKLDRNSDGTPARDATGQPLDITFHE